MKKLLIVLSLLTLISGCSKEPIDNSLLINRNVVKGDPDIMYEPNKQEPYSGNVFELYKDGHKKLEGSYKNGKKDGLWTIWDYNGIKSFEGIYGEGYLYGSWTSWYDARNKCIEVIYNDKANSSNYTSWYSPFDSLTPGNKSRECTLLNEKFPSANVFIYSDFGYVRGYPSGKYSEWHRNGKKSIEKYYKKIMQNDTLVGTIADGLYSEWHENGQKYEEGVYKDGAPEGIWTYWYDNGVKWKELSYNNGKKVGEVLINYR